VSPEKPVDVLEDHVVAGDEQQRNDGSEVDFEISLIYGLLDHHLCTINLAIHACDETQCHISYDYLNTQVLVRTLDCRTLS